MEKKEYYLIDWTMDWADEGDICGFEVVDEEELKNRYKWIDEHQGIDDVEIYWGTNESIYLSVDDLKMHLDEAKHLTEEEYKIVTKVLGRGFGYCNWFEDFVTCYEEDLEEDE